MNLPEDFCTYCWRNGHTVAFCPWTWTGSTNVDHRYCTFCGARDHTIEECPNTWNGNATRYRRRAGFRD